MRRSAAALLLAAAGCVTERAAELPAAPSGPGAILHSAELARVRCLVVAPFENGSDAPLAAETATGALLAGVDPGRTRVFPVTELRALFKDTPLELPQGIPASLALELAELLGADAALWGSVAGRSKDGGELLVTLRLALAGDHRILFADTAVVKVPPNVRSDGAVRRAVLRAARPMLARLGDPVRKRCFDAERTRALRKLALAEAAETRAVARVPAAPVAQPPAVQPASMASVAPSAVPLTPRQAEWATRLAGGGRLLLDGVQFAGRSSALLRDGGLADLKAALLARPAVRIRVEAFVDATSNRAADAKLSAAMAEAAGRRLVELGVPRPRLAWAGRGGESPILPNFTARGRAANRRVEVVVVR
jgi:outer membrane protein OmpA-like peptidoglycan-associated protein